MFTKTLVLGSALALTMMFTTPAWSGNGPGRGIDRQPRDSSCNCVAGDDLLSQRGRGNGAGHGPGDGTGNGGSGPKDGTGNGRKSGNCVNFAIEGVETILARNGGGGHGQEDGTGNGLRPGNCRNA